MICCYECCNPCIEYGANRLTDDIDLMRPGEPITYDLMTNVKETSRDSESITYQKDYITRVGTIAAIGPHKGGYAGNDGRISMSWNGETLRIPAQTHMMPQGRINRVAFVTPPETPGEWSNDLCSDCCCDPICLQIALCPGCMSHRIAYAAWGMENRGVQCGFCCVEAIFCVVFPPPLYNILAASIRARRTYPLVGWRYGIFEEANECGACCTGCCCPCCALTRAYKQIEHDVYPGVLCCCSGDPYPKGRPACAWRLSEGLIPPEDVIR